MKDSKDIVACVSDFGLFIHVARRLAKDFKKVYYTTEPDESYPHIHNWCIGDGYPEIKWVESLFEVIDEIDLAVFPDIGRAFHQEACLKRGIPVWGSRHADGLESRRGLFLKALKSTNLPVPKYKVAKGITNLRLLLEKEGDKFIKTSTYRGDFETMHFRSMEEDGGILDEWAVKLGPFREMFKFYVFDKIETKIEGGCDTWRVNGQWPKVVMQGFENKDKSYLMTFCDYDELPKEVRVVNDEFGPILDAYDYRGPFSTEVRITDDHKSYFLDPTNRYASPVSQAQTEMIDNYGEIVWKGANGICVDPEYRDENRFSVQAIFHCKRSHWTILNIPKEIEPHVKVSCSCMVNGMICVPPDPDDMESTEVGWVCATGSTIEYAIHNLLEYAKQMPCGVEVETESIGDLLKEVNESQEHGMKFTDSKVPEPSVVID